MPQLEIAPLSSLLSHSRFLLTLRSREGHYRSLILFRLSSSLDYKPCEEDDEQQQEGEEQEQERNQEQEQEQEQEQKQEQEQEEDANAPPDPQAPKALGGTLTPAHPESTSKSKSTPQIYQIYVIESSCPHLGADLSHAEIEECEASVVAVCPWHRYDFDLRTGKSETGLRACTFAVEVRTDLADGVDGVEKVYMMETPEEGTGWRLVELRPVSEEFADPPPPSSSTTPGNPISTTALPPPQDDEPVVPLSNPPTTLMQWAVLILNTPNPRLKVERTQRAVHLFRTGKLTSIGHKSANAPRPPDVPLRDAAYSRNVVDPTKVKNRRNRAAMLHALANIEQWAIDLAWDIMARFGPTNPHLPPAFFADFTKMALDEAKHFTLLTSRLTSLSPHTPFGTLPVHTSLWDSATTTAHSLLSRLAIIHLVHEARGLDVNPATIARFRKAGDGETVEAMEVIHADEVTHVTAGHRWFVWACEWEGRAMGGGAGGGAGAGEGCKRVVIDPVARFREEVRKGWTGDVKGPFNEEARERAGLTPEFYVGLRGELGVVPIVGERVEKKEAEEKEQEEAKEGEKEEKAKGPVDRVAAPGVAAAALTVEYERE